MRSPRLLALALLLATPVVANGPGDGPRDWPQYRGDGTGHSSETGLPLAWNETATPEQPAADDGSADESSIAWKVPVPGRGHSSPIVVDGTVWLTAAFGDSRDEVAATRDAEPSLRLLGFDLETGAPRHDLELFRPEAWQEDHPDNSYASPTPAADLEPVTVEGKKVRRLCAHFGTYGTACFALEAAPETGDTGDTVPRLLFKGRPFPQEHEVGPGSSPILWRDLLIVNCDATESQFVAALDVWTGEERWRYQRPGTAERKPPHRKAFSTPLAFRYGPHWRLLTTGATATTALDPATGEAIWWLRHEGYSNVPMPVVGLGRAYVNTGYMKPHLLAVELGGEGDVTGAPPEGRVAWSYHWQVPANPTPLFVDRHLFFTSDWGIATWLDPIRGEDVWRQRLKGKFSASPLYADGRIYTWSRDGETVVIEPGAPYRELARNHLDGAIHATPAISHGSILVRTDRHLYRLLKPKS